MLVLRNLSYSYGTTVALDNISLSIQNGAFLSVIGPSASGKSTLLKVLSGILKPREGSITVSGRVGLVFQCPENQLFEDTVLKDVMFAPKTDKEKKAKQALQLVGLNEELYNRHPLSLSGGERRLVAIAGILAMEPDILLLDEPSAGLDYVTKTRLFTLLQHLHYRGKTIIFSSHNMNDVASYASEVLYLNHGTLKACGPAAHILTLPDVPQCDALSIASALRAHGLDLDASPLTLADLEQSL